MCGNFTLVRATVSRIFARLLDSNLPQRQDVTATENLPEMNLSAVVRVLSEGVVVLNRSEVIGQHRNVEWNRFAVAIRKKAIDFAIRTRSSIGNTIGLARDDY